MYVCMHVCKNLVRWLKKTEGGRYASSHANLAKGVTQASSRLSRQAG